MHFLVSMTVKSCNWVLRPILAVAANRSISCWRVGVYSNQWSCADWIFRSLLFEPAPFSVAQYDSTIIIAYRGEKNPSNVSPLDLWVIIQFPLPSRSSTGNGFPHPFRSCCFRDCSLGGFTHPPILPLKNQPNTGYKNQPFHGDPYPPFGKTFLMKLGKYVPA